jgi:hypothetical protein
MRSLILSRRIEILNFIVSNWEKPPRYQVDIFCARNLSYNLIALMISQQITFVNQKYNLIIGA